MNLAITTRNCKKNNSFFRLLLLMTLTAPLSGCFIFNPLMPSMGPSKMEVTSADSGKNPVSIVDVDEAVAQRVLAEQKRVTFAQQFPDNSLQKLVIGPGDTVQVSIWEAPPATLFAALDPRTGSASVSQTTSIPEQMVAADGSVRIPFAGEVNVSGKTPEEVEVDIAQRLTGLANKPQVLVRVTHNATANVTVVGEVSQSMRMQLTTRGERLLDAIASTGGLKQPVNKMTIQLSRNGQVDAMAMDDIIRDPSQNILLHAGDVVTAMYQPLSFTVLGATGKNEEMNFEARGITLAQALGRIGGVDDQRANPQGVFIFRFENPAAVDAGKKKLVLTPEGKTPVVYKIDLKDPKTFLVAQNFPIRDKDVMYVATAPAWELQKFLNIIYTGVYSTVSIGSM